MAYYDRDYYREESTGGIRRQLTGATVVAWIIGINVVVYLFDSIVSGSRRADAVSPSYWGDFSVDAAVYHFQAWRWVTYQFLHGGFFHVLFNMLALYYFGPFVERWLGWGKFLAFYLLCGVGGALLFTLLAFFPSAVGTTVHSPMVGASGGIFGVLIACAVINPRGQASLLFLPITMTMRTMALVFLGIATLSVLVGGANAGGDTAHLGGALVGFVLSMRPQALNIFDRVSLGQFSPRRLAEKRRKARRQKRVIAERDFEREIDAILEKVARHGLQSLTKKEKKMLHTATERQRQS
jgi:membrane associated rhomboid family serine protease